MTLETLTEKLKPFEETIEHPLLKWLYLHLPPRPVSRKKTHRAYATVASVLMHERAKGKLDPASSKAIVQYLTAVVPFIEAYEKKACGIEPSSPEEMMHFLMEQNGLSQYDLAKELGGQPVVSDILRGKRKLTREHIERLSKRFHISPASFYSVI